MSELQQAVERLRKCRLGVSLYHVYEQPFTGAGREKVIGRYRCDVEKIAHAYLTEHALKPLEAYLAFANVLCVKEAGLDYDAAVAMAKAMHKRGMVIPNE